MSKVFTTAVVLAMSLGMGGSIAMAQTAVEIATKLAAPAAVPVQIQNFSIGAADAKVVINEFLSFTCPHCAAFKQQVYPQLKADYIDTGKVRLIQNEVYFDRYGLWAAMIARCGGEVRYFGISDKLYATQNEWAASKKADEVIENLKKIGRTAGLDDAQMDLCVKDTAMAQAMIDHYRADYTAAGIEGTPGFLINGVKHTNMSYDELKVLIDAELAK